MSAMQFPVAPAAVVDATKASSPVAAVVAAMRRIDPAGGPVAADQVRAWANTLMAELYSAHVARWEYRHKDDVGPGCWMQADAAQVCYADTRGLVIRALFDKPRVPQPEKEHVFQNRSCTRCGDSEDWAGPDCMPPELPVDPRSRLPFDPRWLLQPLQWLIDAGPIPINSFDRRSRAKEATFLRDQLNAYIEECEKP
ncbi:MULTISPECIES: hypothetical protein [Stenotrophomonas]|uniref:hypothetical protein n=1 Tax=Stenotrophomonas TaxID=40323 RepID=UPI000B737A1B|nr:MULTISPECIES: hypothetical protein [Stenotrophomonas]SMR69336.1 hypothetical protein SAMN04487863_0303 [Stenotrophomonas sp. yr243]SNT57771.1 hypothetical protein SAMN05518671_3610 [Stenotrophomonas lactitubi]